MSSVALLGATFFTSSAHPPPRDQILKKFPKSDSEEILLPRIPSVRRIRDTTMETIHRFTHRILPITFNLKTISVSPFLARPAREPVFRPIIVAPQRRNHSSAAQAGWFLGMTDRKSAPPDIVKAGDPVLHEAAQEVQPDEIGSERIQKIIDDMVKVMRNAPGVGLAAPQIGIPLRIIVLEDTKEYMRYTTKEEIKAQDRQAFDLLVVINPKLEKKGNRSAFFFEGCLSVDGFRAIVERHLEVEVTGFDRYGQAIKVDASGWQARIFQHECDHLDGTLYVDKMAPRTFRTTQNLDLPLAAGCPKLGVR